MLLRNNPAILGLLLCVALFGSNTLAQSGSGSGSDPCLECEDFVNGACVLSLAGKVCSQSMGVCELNATCDGVSRTCTREFRPSSYRCRAAVDACDAADYCTGANETCFDSLRLPGEICRNSTSACDMFATCDGSSTTCPSNSFLQAGTVCDSQCGINYTCSGTSATCSSSPAPCNAAGSCSLNQCHCNPGYNGTYCASCASQYYGTNCIACPACGAHGSCSDGKLGSGLCVCSAGYVGTQCNARVQIVLTASVPVNGAAVVVLSLTDSSNGAPALNSSVFISIDDSQIYRANSTTKSFQLSIVNGQAVFNVNCSVFGVVSITTTDTLGNNYLPTTANITFPNIANTVSQSNPPMGSAYVQASMRVDSFPCESYSTGILTAVANSIAAAVGKSVNDISMTGVTCGDSNTVLARRTSPSGLDVAYRIVLPSESDVSALIALLNTVTTANGNGTSLLLQTLQTQPQIIAVLAATNVTLSLLASIPTVAVSGVNCSLDTWTAWSPCLFQRCNGGDGVQTRSRRCPAVSEIRLCSAPACGNCSVNNGGCSSFATCKIASDQTSICTCAGAYFGDGYTCVSRNSSASLALIVTLRYPVALDSVAPLGPDVLNLQNALNAKVASILSISTTRIAYAEIVDEGASSFKYTFSIAPPSVSTDALADVLNDIFAAAVAAGQMDLPTASAAVASRSTSMSVYPPSTAGSTTTGSDSWATSNIFYIAIAFACFFAILSIVLLLVLQQKRRSGNMTPTKGPSWLAQSRPSQVNFGGQSPYQAGGSSSNINNNNAYPRNISVRKSMAAVGPSNGVIPIPELYDPAPSELANPLASPQKTTPWEEQAIENDLPSIPAVRHYYPGWESPLFSTTSLNDPATSPSPDSGSKQPASASWI